ncbi:MAG: phosphoribosylformylglycinamidine synthase [Actinomycetaceae bacterium]|nr:phosphoribosylformylglycinamidine synthase [Arcanobacterium sp.]MDD7504329.1 phosphoribosylformylglycinamidine synthase [Actinomycetaceae bacterium]MDY6143922.1 phosphoribosylformylglycinamidine synthase [Arcanobacterium sp.]
MDARLVVRRKPEFRSEEASLLDELNALDGVDLASVELYFCYEAFNASEDDISSLAGSIVCDARVDSLITSESFASLARRPSLGIEYLPGQYDQRADAATQALALVQPGTAARIYSSRLIVFDPEPSVSARRAITSHLVNPVESREKDFSTLSEPQLTHPKGVEQFPDFLTLNAQGLEKLRRERAMAMSFEDLALVQQYFIQEGRVPTDVELAALDTYWSDHCRHTTFNTELTDIRNGSQLFASSIDEALERWDELRRENGRAGKPRSLMDLGTIMGKELRRTGRLNSQEVSAEINACSVHVQALNNQGDAEPWLLMFKNETHNHPTEIEPFGGASTCLGGAIRDPLSGRSWVYQGLRISGAGDVTTPRSATLPGKLPQRDISTRATLGFSSYGNQIGMATTAVHEYVHPGYVAKRMELGAVVAGAPEANVRRLEPQLGDVVILLGGRTGRDGIGGATGSSKAHDKDSLELSGAEVQKGNPVNERKIQRLFRNPDAAQLIVRCNDFGAGGVCVAIGELAESLDIFLDRVPLKYSGLSAKEIAISESQERMAVVVRNEDQQRFLDLARSENLEATVVANVTDTGRLRMIMNDAVVLDLSRAFLDTNGAPRSQNVVITDADTSQPIFATLGAARSSYSFGQASTDVSETADDTRLLSYLASAGIGQQIGMIEQFDSTVGRSTVLMPLGGKYQRTVECVSAQTLPVPGGSPTTSVMAYGYSPAIADYSPYLMGAYSVIEALAKLSAAGADSESAWLTVQEYFQRPDDDPHVWGDVTQSLLGLLDAQEAFGVAAIGGKDSMSGSFGADLHVPPTLVSFAISVMDAGSVISATLPARKLNVWYLPHEPEDSGKPNYEQLCAHFAAFGDLAARHKVAGASAVHSTGLAAALANMCLGNRVGFNIDAEFAERLARTEGGAYNYLTATPIGGIIFATEPGFDVVQAFASAGHPDAAVLIGTTTDTHSDLDFGVERFSIGRALTALDHAYSQVYPVLSSNEPPLEDFAVRLPQGADFANELPDSMIDHRNAPHVLLPVFPGTNSEYDMAEAFEAAGATTEFLVIRNLTPELLKADTAAFIEKLQSADILAFSGGFSLGDEPDGSAKFIANFLRAPAVSEGVKAFVSKGNLVLGICNGFQALVKSGFLPYGDPDKLTSSSPTLTHNTQLRHVSRIATTRVTSTSSPWLAGFAPGMIHKVPVSHGEGRFVVDEASARQLFSSGQVAFQYVDFDGVPTASAPENPNGSSYAIEGIISPDGRILGKMGHPERFRPGLMANIPGITSQDIFHNAVAYCRSRKKDS